jgi:hypothetical protein
MAESIDAWLRELREAVTSDPRLRRTRIVVEARDHLCSTADELEREGIPRAEAEAQAVARLGSPRSFAAGFARPAARDRLVDATAWLLPRVATALLGLGAVMVLIETFAWSVNSSVWSEALSRCLHNAAAC